MPYRLIDPARNPRLRMWLHAIGGAATGIIFVGGVALAITTYQLVDAVRDTQVNSVQRSQDTRAAAEAAERSAARIEDCTTPGRECFRESQRRLSQTVSGINDYAKYAAACADKPRQQTVAEIEACIETRIALDKRAQRSGRQ